MADASSSTTVDASLPGASRFNDSRASVDSTRDGVGANYDRIRVPSELRDNILSGINDSSTSLDYYDDEEDESAGAGVTGKAVPTAGNNVAGGALSASPATPEGKKRTANAVGGGAAGSRLKESVQSSDLETPRAEVRDPLAHKGAQLSGGGVSPLSGPTTSAATNQGGMLGDDLGTESGRTLSKTSTREDEDGVGGGDAPKRPGTMRRLTSRIKKTMSSKG